MSTKQFTINTLASVQNILNSRATITEAMEGTSTIVTVRGNGNIIAVKNKAGDQVPAIGTDQPLEKQIFNTVCNSALAIKNERNQGILRAGYAAEKAGNAEEAGKHYNDYLNKTQVSVSVLSTQGLFNRIKDGDEIRGKVQKITTENGSILTLDPKSLSIKETAYAPTTKVDLMSMAVEVPSEEVKAPAEEVVANA